MSAHTPGPWATSLTQPTIVHTGTAPGLEAIKIGLDCRGSGRTESEQIGNARLIAAAPEMLEALRFLRDAIEGDAGMTDDLCDQVAEKVRVAIAKAEGRT